MKARQVKAERTIVERKLTCIVCGAKPQHAYGMLRQGKCVCSRECNEKYLKGEYHDG